MGRHTRTFRTPREWRRNDLHVRGGALGLRRGVRLYRREPVLLFWICLYGTLSVCVPAALLAALGRTDLLWVFEMLAVMIGAGFTDGRIERARAKYPDLMH